MKQIHPLRLLVKTLCLFILANLLFAAWNPPVGRISGYNLVFPGRTRLPFGGGLTDFNISVDNLDAMFASHVIAAPRQPGEFRVVLLGDSSVWGVLLYPNQTLSAQLNDLQISCPGKNLRFFNLGYPHPSVVKDLLLMDKALEYKPDLIIWVLTTNSLNSKSANPFLLENMDRVSALEQRLRLKDETRGPGLAPKTLFDKTFIGEDRQLARLLLLQALGPVWAATGLDQVPPGNYTRLSNDLEKSLRFGGMNQPGNIRPTLRLDYLDAGARLSGNIPLVYVNEPIFIATGKNSDIRYNATAPRWAYSQYRSILSRLATARHWDYIDLWNAIPAQDFTDSEVHLSVDGEQLLAKALQPVIQKNACP